MEGVDVMTFPAAYLFLKGRKERPVELTVHGDGGIEGGDIEVVDVIN